MTFIDDLLLESEQKDIAQQIQMSRLRADQVLMALTVLEGQVDAVNQLVDEELKILEDYRMVELNKLQKKMSWLEYNLESFMRTTGEKTLNLAHGSIKLRMGRDKIEITDLAKFTPFGERQGLFRQIPEKTEPDAAKILAYVKQTGEIPSGVAMTPAKTNFSYKTLKGQNNGNGQTVQSEVGAEAE